MARGVDISSWWRQGQWNWWRCWGHGRSKCPLLANGLFRNNNSKKDVYKHEFLISWHLYTQPVCIVSSLFYDQYNDNIWVQHIFLRGDLCHLYWVPPLHWELCHTLLQPNLCWRGRVSPLLPPRLLWSCFMIKNPLLDFQLCVRPFSFTSVCVHSFDHTSFIASPTLFFFS